MRLLSIGEVEVVSGGLKMQEVVIKGHRMSVEEKIAYDNEYLASDLLMAAWDTCVEWLRSWWE